MTSGHVALRTPCATRSALRVILPVSRLRHCNPDRQDVQRSPALTLTTIMRATRRLFSLSLVSAVSSRVAGPLVVQPDGVFSGAQDVKVPVVLGVMSGCPDALLCESVFDRVIERVSDKIDLRLTFIGE